VEQLGRDQGVVPVGRFGEPGKTRDEPVLAEPDHSLHAAGVPVHGAAPDEKKGRPALCPLLVERHETVRHLALLVAVTQMHGRHDDAVLQGERPDLDGRKEVFHGMPSSRKVITVRRRETAGIGNPMPLFC